MNNNSFTTNEVRPPPNKKRRFNTLKLSTKRYQQLYNRESNRTKRKRELRVKLLIIRKYVFNFLRKVSLFSLYYSLFSEQMITYMMDMMVHHLLKNVHFILN